MLPIQHLHKVAVGGVRGEGEVLAAALLPGGVGADDDGRGEVGVDGIACRAVAVLAPAVAGGGNYGVIEGDLVLARAVGEDLIADPAGPVLRVARFLRAAPVAVAPAGVVACCYEQPSRAGASGTPGVKSGLGDPADLLVSVSASEPLSDGSEALHDKEAQNNPWR